MKTLATRGRSSALPVSFSTIDARITISSGELIGRPSIRFSHISARNCSCWTSHLFNHFRPGRSALEWISIRHDAAFCRNFGRHRAFQNLVFRNPLHDLDAGKALGNGDLVNDTLAGNNCFHHIAHAHARLEGVFTGLECLGIPTCLYAL